MGQLRDAAGRSGPATSGGAERHPVTVLSGPGAGGSAVNVESVLVQALNGLSFGALLFLLASGFTLIFGLLRIVNLSHGALYLSGGYVALVTLTATGSYPLAVLAAGLVVGTL